jgi:hypothetical protein
MAAADFASRAEAPIFMRSGFRGGDLSVRGDCAVRNPQALLATAFQEGRAQEVTRLYRRDDVPEEDCWLTRDRWVPSLSIVA